MTTNGNQVTIRSLEEIDLDGIVALDEKISGNYRPEIWERRVGYYLRRDPEASMVAVADGTVLGFMLGEVRSGEFGLEEPTGWIEVLGVDPETRGQSIGRRLVDQMLDGFRERGAVTVRTLVESEMSDIASFFEAVGFAESALKPLAMKL